jgi:hypothetical protein
MKARNTLFILSFSLLLISCAESTANNAEEISNQDSLITVADEDSTTETKVITEAEDYESNNLEDLGLELLDISSVNGIKIGMSETEVSEILGSAESVSSSEYWAVDGGDHSWWYYSDSSLVLEFVEYDSQEGSHLEIIELTKPSDYSTNRGISVGTTQELVKEQYSKAIEISNWKDDDLEIQLGDAGAGGLFITIADGLVSRIYFGSIIRC